MPTCVLGEQHAREDLGRIPMLADWLRCIKGEPWMVSRVRLDPPLRRLPLAKPAEPLRLRPDPREPQLDPLPPVT